MKVRMEISMAGPEHQWLPGRVYDVEDEEAQRLIRAGYATPADESEVAIEQPGARRVAPQEQPKRGRGRPKKGG